MICLKIKKETIIQSDDLEKIEKKEEERYFFENEKKNGKKTKANLLFIFYHFIQFAII